MDRTPLKSRGWCPAMSQSPPSPDSPCQPFDSQVGFGSQMFGSQAFGSPAFISPARTPYGVLDERRGLNHAVLSSARQIGSSREAHTQEEDSDTDEDHFNETAGGASGSCAVVHESSRRNLVPGIQVLGGTSANDEDDSEEEEEHVMGVEEKTFTPVKHEDTMLDGPDDGDHDGEDHLGLSRPPEQLAQQSSMAWQAGGSMDAEMKEREDKEEEILEKEEEEEEEDGDAEDENVQVAQVVAHDSVHDRQQIVQLEQPQEVDDDADIDADAEEDEEEEAVDADADANGAHLAQPADQAAPVRLVAEQDGIHPSADVDMEQEEEEEPEHDEELPGEHQSGHLQEPLADGSDAIVPHEAVYGTQEAITHVSQALVELPAEGVVHQQIVATAGVSETWSSLPPEAHGQWTVAGDICSLNISGSVMKLPLSVYERLYKYQRQGVAWMWNLYQKQFGGILADDMGLGKTVQVVAFLACLQFAKQGSRFLVVVPPSLLEQWRREIGTWAGDTDINVHMLHGTLQERRAALRGLATKGGVLLTTYDMVRNHVNVIRSASLTAASILPRKRKRSKRGLKDDDSPSEEDEELLRAAGVQAGRDVPWDVVIADEAHQVKNPSSAAGKDLRRVNSRSRFLLTGTPLQNKLTDLWAIMDLAQPSLLGNFSTFERNFSDQIARGSKKNASKWEVELKDHLARELKKLTAPHFLRRTKLEVSQPASVGPSSAEAPDAPTYQELPRKTDVVLWLHLTQAQMELYELYLASETVRRGEEGGKCSMETLRAIALLKKLCNHPLLLLPTGEFNEWLNTVVPTRQAKQSRSIATAPPPPPPAAEPSSSSGAAPASDARASQASQGGDEEAPEVSQVMPRLKALMPNSVEAAALLSCKLRILSLLLPQLHRRGHRCLIFSQQLGMLDLVQNCVLRVLGLKFLRIDGQIDPRERDLKLTKFQDPESRYFCLCMSTQVCGVGLTITGADRVILVDPAWNPAMDCQAIDRVHRIGQDKEVVVYRLIGAAAIEDKMFRLQVFKRGLAKTAFEHEQQLRLFTHKELKSLFQVPSQAESTQSLMAEQLGTEALEHEDLLRVVAGDVGGTSDPQALAFWQSSDVLGFSDYEKLFMYLEQAQQAETDDVEEKARALAQNLRSEEYKKFQVVEGKWRARDQKENLAPQVEGSCDLVLQDG